MQSQFEYIKGKNMEKLNILEIIIPCNGTVVRQGNENTEIDNISTDSRTITANDLFIPLVGEKFDGHDFVVDVLNNKSPFVLINRDRWQNIESQIDDKAGYWIILVNDTLKAYQNIAEYYMGELNCKKIAVTGSNGKTSTKEMILSLLSGHFNIKANEGNFNNQIGVPKTVFTIDSENEIALIEMGTGKHGDIDKLSKIVKPDYAVITNIGLAHTEFLGGQDGVAQEKREIFNHIHSESKGILNEDDPYFPFLKENLSQSQLLSFSVQNNSHIKVIENLGLDGYKIEYKNQPCHFKMGGNHNLINLHFALLIAEDLNVPKEKIVGGIENIKPAKMRNETTKGDYTIIKDCYNANPSSMKAGLDFVHNIKTSGKKIAVLGDMLELGSETESLHKEIGEYFSTLNFDYLFTLGELGEKIAEGAKQNPLNKKIHAYNNQNDLTESLLTNIKKDDLIYFKASRGMQLEKIVEEIEKKRTKPFAPIKP